MARPTQIETEKMKKAMKSYVANGMSLSQIARLTGKSSQAVHQFLVKHGMPTAGMEKRQKKNLDKISDAVEGQEPTIEGDMDGRRPDRGDGGGR